MALRLGICSDSTSEAFDRAARFGYKGVQVALAPKDGDLMAGAKELTDLATSYGLEIVSVNVPFRPADVQTKADEIDRFAEAADATGATFLRGFVPPYIRQPEGQELDFWGQVRQSQTDLAAWEPILRKHGLRLALEMHDGYITAACSSSWILLHELPAECFAVVHDAENMVREGIEHWMKGFEILGDYLGYLHVKNMAWQPLDETDEGYWDMPHNHYKWKPRRTALPDGIVDWRFLIDCLKKRHWDGWLMLEDLRQDIPEGQKLQEDHAFLAPLLT